MFILTKSIIKFLAFLHEQTYYFIIFTLAIQKWNIQNNLKNS